MLLFPLAYSARTYFDPAGASFVPTRYRQLQHAVLQIGIDLRGVQVGPERERSREVGLADLGVLQPQPGRSRHHRLGFDEQITVVDLHVEPVLRYARQIRPQDDALAIFKDIDRRRDGDPTLGRLPSLPTTALSPFLASSVVAFMMSSFDSDVSLNGNSSWLGCLPLADAHRQAAIGVLRSNFVGVRMLR